MDVINAISGPASQPPRLTAAAAALEGCPVLLNVPRLLKSQI